ncbi:uncharacterized protein APUU_12290A [Aspergillus puulaauensis]|uniref:DUF7702 domain-containing protein n=1 Tax=Aspergillus puulaauensis TaxID=1220207 RepID=A0A7R7XDK3_9EURO|nr:uncharacterized protein APUU_12290A [Aspergillus puulaauensis]BCS19462.1 hypothetical protein APUU_12290A [Aspergillus puulaauensis]
MLTPHQSLSIALIIFYTPSLAPTSFLLHKHSIGKAWGWLYLFVFAILRVAGAALQFASESSDSNGLRRAAATLASIGVMTLLLAMLEIIEDVKSTFASDPIHPRVWTLLHLSQYAAFILSVIYSFTSRDDLSHAAAIIVTCLFACEVLICIVFYIRLRGDAPKHMRIADDDNCTQSPDKTTLLRLALCSTPCLTVRVVYLLLSTFANGPEFQGRDLDGDGDADTPANVYIVAFMQYMMEFIVFVLFLYAGFVIPSLRKARRAEKERERESGNKGLELRGGSGSV